MLGRICMPLLKESTFEWSEMFSNVVRCCCQGTARRKKKVVHRTATTDDKKLQSSLKKLAVNNIPGIEEVSIPSN